MKRSAFFYLTTGLMIILAFGTYIVADAGLISSPATWHNGVSGLLLVLAIIALLTLAVGLYSQNGEDTSDEEREEIIEQLQEVLDEARALVPTRGWEIPTFADDRSRAAKVRWVVEGVGGVYNITLEELGTDQDELDDLAAPRSDEGKEALAAA